MMSPCYNKKVFSLIIIGMTLWISPTEGAPLERIQYNHPNLTVDLGVGLWGWPLPMDYDHDGDYDMVVSCNDKPYNGIYLFENTEGDVKLPRFEPGRRIASGLNNIQVSYVEGEARILVMNQERVDFRKNQFSQGVEIYPEKNIHVATGTIRANQWKYCDFDGDNDSDLVVGIGDWTEYGWDNAFNENGVWQNGPLHGYVYLISNNGTSEAAEYGTPEKLQAGGKPIDVYGMPSPNLADFDGDGDLDLICGEFIDQFTYFENKGSRQNPRYAAGRSLLFNGKPIQMDLCMIVPVAIDWDKDGDVDLVVGQEDGRVALVENSGKLVDGTPEFLKPVFFQQKAADVKFGALVTPFGVDWDSDGDEDLICGNTAGYIGFIENLGLGENGQPKWSQPVCLEAGGEVIRIMAGKNGSIQGPCETKWGYTTLSVADWDGDGLLDIMANSIWGKIVWYKNTGAQRAPRLAKAQPVAIDWEGEPQKPQWNWWNPGERELVTQWRTTPFMTDLNRDGRMDLVMLDCQGYLAYYERVQKNGELMLAKPQRLFKLKENETENLLRLTNGQAGRSGRRKLCLVDWDRDGKIDLLVNDKNVRFYKNITTEAGGYLFFDQGLVDNRVLAGHTTSPTTVDWDKNGIPDLLVGAEDGFFYYLSNPNN